jgi:hypothetical protein
LLENLCLVHFSAKGPAGILESSIIGDYLVASKVNVEWHGCK